MGREAERESNHHPKHSEGLDAEIMRAIKPLVDSYQATRSSNGWHMTHYALRQLVNSIKDG